MPFDYLLFNFLSPRSGLGPSPAAIAARNKLRGPPPPIPPLPPVDLAPVPAPLALVSQAQGVPILVTTLTQPVAVGASKLEVASHANCQPGMIATLR